MKILTAIRHQNRVFLAGDEAELLEACDTRLLNSMHSRGLIRLESGILPEPIEVDDPELDDPEDQDGEQEAPINATDGAVKAAKARGINLALVNGTGKDGKITKPDVDAYGV